jgi:hypothetical protein
MEIGEKSVQLYFTDFRALVRWRGLRRVSGGLEFEEDGGAAGLKIQGAGAAVVIAKDGGAEAQTEARGLSCSLRGHKRIEGTIGVQEAGTGVRDEDLYRGSLAAGLKAYGLAIVCCSGEIAGFDSFNGELKAMEHGLA